MALQIRYFIFLLLFSAISVSAQESTESSERTLVIYDSSNSMWGELEDTSRKYEAGRNALTNFLSGDHGNREIGFRAYGHRSKDDCRDTELMVPFSSRLIQRWSLNVCEPVLVRSICAHRRPTTVNMSATVPNVRIEAAGIIWARRWGSK